MRAYRNNQDPTALRVDCGTGEMCVCGQHRKRCIFGRPHVYQTWYRDGKLMRTVDTYHCCTCDAVCIGDESA